MYYWECECGHHNEFSIGLQLGSMELVDECQGCRCNAVIEVIPGHSKAVFCYFMDDEEED